jgi:ABC-type uncharacterized transport system substrate-binding protein
VNRRTFLCGLTLGTVSVPLVGEARQAGKLPRVGYVQAELPALAPLHRAFIEGLRDRGWSHGRNVAIDWRRRDEEIPDLVRLNVDVMVLPNPYRLEAGLKQTKTIPIVTVDRESDPVAKGFIRSLSRPGGNLTGIWLHIPDIVGKQLQILKEAVPAMRRVAVVCDERVAGLQFTATQTAARLLNIAVEPAALQHESEADDVVKRALPARPQAIFLLTSPIVLRAQGRIAQPAVQHRLPSVSGFSTFPDDGGLMAYGPDFPTIFRQIAGYVDRILRGAKPRDLPVKRPTKFELRINLKTAKALGLTIPQSVLLRADEIIQ